MDDNNPKDFFSLTALPTVAGRSQVESPETSENTSVLQPNPLLQPVPVQSNTVETSSRLVDFDGPEDILNPQNWPVMKKIYTFAITCLATMIVALTSSIFATAIPSLVTIYGVSREIANLGISLYVLGFATGPLIWAPFSELKGRRLPLLLGTFCFSAFSFATAASKDIQSIFICRFFAGFFGACPLTLSGATSGDMLRPHIRPIGMVCFSLMVFVGPLLAPLIGGFIVMNNHLTWRWTHYLPGILGTTSFLSLLFLLEETYAPVILVSKAQRLRRETGDWSIHALHEETAHLDLPTISKNYLSTPLKMLAFDPPILAMCIFGAFVYGLLYLFLTAYPFIFQNVHNLNPGVSGIPYTAVIIGQVLAGVAMYLRQRRIKHKMRANNNTMVPEWLLPIAIPGSVAFSAGLLWLGWSGYRADYHPIVPTLSGLLTGFGLIAMFLPSVAYVAEVRRTRAASAIAAHTFLRSLAGSGFPLFAGYMFNSLGIQWALTVLGCVAACIVPVPIVLYIYGARIRARSRLVL